MNPELFREHHPHTLGDYVVRGFVGFARSVVSALGKHRYVDRALIANTIIASFSMSLAYALHMKAVLRGDPRRDRIEELLGEASAAHFHIIVMQKLGTLKGFAKFVLAILQGLGSLCFRFMVVCSPSLGHRLLGYVYEKSITDYTIWIDAIRKEVAANIPADPLALQYWELLEGSTLVEVLESMRMDNIRSRDREHEYGDKKQA